MKNKLKINGMRVCLAAYLLSLLTACSWKEADNLKEYESYVNDPANGLVKEVTNGEAVFKAKFISPDLMALRSKNARSNQSIQEAREQFKWFYHFDMQIGSNSTEDVKKLLQNRVSQKEFSEAVEYYQFHLTKDLKVVLLQDTIPCTFYHMSQSGGLDGSFSFTAAFEIDEIYSGYPYDIRLIFYDRQLVNDKLLFDFDKNDLANLPKMRF